MQTLSLEQDLITAADQLGPQQCESFSNALRRIFFPACPAPAVVGLVAFIWPVFAGALFLDIPHALVRLIHGGQICDRNAVGGSMPGLTVDHLICAAVLLNGVRSRAVQPPREPDARPPPPRSRGGVRGFPRARDLDRRVIARERCDHRIGTDPLHLARFSWPQWPSDTVDGNEDITQQAGCRSPPGRRELSGRSPDASWREPVDTAAGDPYRTLEHVRPRAPTCAGPGPRPRSPRSRSDPQRGRREAQ